MYFKKSYLHKPRCRSKSVLEEMSLTEALGRGSERRKSTTVVVKGRSHDVDLGCSFLTPRTVCGNEDSFKF